MANRPDGLYHAVVTGGAGFLGSHLCDALIRAGYYVTCVDNFETGKQANLSHLESEPRFQLVRSDANNGIELDSSVDVVYHFALPAAPSDYVMDPVATMRAASLGSLNALDLARRRGARFVLASTSEVYGPHTREPSREDDVGTVNPVSTYGAYYESRRFSEALTTAYRTTYNVSTAIARIFNTYGPRMRLDDGRILSRFIRQAVTGAPLTVPGSGKQTRSLCYVDDAVAGIMALAGGTYPGPVNIGSPDEVSVFSLARELVDIVPGTQLVFVDAPAEDSQARRPDISLATELLGWQPRTSVKEGLATTVAWFKGAGALHA